MDRLMDGWWGSRRRCGERSVEKVCIVREVVRGDGSVGLVVKRLWGSVVTEDVRFWR